MMIENSIYHRKDTVEIQLEFASRQQFRTIIMHSKAFLFVILIAALSMPFLVNATHLVHRVDLESQISNQNKTTSSIRLRGNTGAVAKLSDRQIIEEFDGLMSKSTLSQSERERMEYLLSLHDISDEEMKSELHHLSNNTINPEVAVYCGSGGFNDIYGNCIYSTTSYAQDYSNAGKRYYSSSCTASQWSGYTALSFASKMGCKAASTVCGGYSYICKSACKSLFKIAVKNYCNGNANYYFDTSFRTCGSYWCCNWYSTRPC